MTALGDFLRSLEGFRIFGEYTPHLVLALDVKLARFHAHAVGVVERFSGLDAHQNFLRIRVLAGQIMAVVRRDERNTGFLTDLNQKGKDALSSSMP